MLLFGILLTNWGQGNRRKSRGIDMENEDLKIMANLMKQ